MVLAHVQIAHDKMHISLYERVRDDITWNEHYAKINKDVNQTQLMFFDELVTHNQVSKFQQDISSLIIMASIKRAQDVPTIHGAWFLKRVSNILFVQQLYLLFK